MMMLRHVEQILEGVELNPQGQEIAEQLVYDTDLGFLRLPGVQYTGRIALIGFGVSGWQEGTYAISERYHPLVNFRDTPDKLITVDRLGKGSGARLYNTAQATAGAEEQYKCVGLYATEIDPNKLKDYRRSYDDFLVGKMRRVVRHGLLKGPAKVIGDKNIIALNELRYRKKSALLYSQTVSGERLKNATAAPKSPVKEELLIVRTPAELNLLGTFLFPAAAEKA